MNKYRKIARVLWLILIANIVVAAVKMSLGTLLNINSLTADGFHAITDSSSNIIGLIGIWFASKPADEEHPYGHKKFETIAGMVIGFSLFVITLRIVYSAIMWFIEPSVPNITLISLIALIFTLIINIFVAIYEYKQGVALESDVLISDSIHTKSDILISSGVLITLIGIKLGLPAYIDPIVSLVIAIFVFHSCYEIFKATIGVLVDKKVIDEQQVIEIVSDLDDILDVHRVRSRGRNDHIFVDLHIITHSNKTVKEAHVLSHQIEAVLKEVFHKDIEVFVHIEPSEPSHLTKCSKE